MEAASIQIPECSTSENTKYKGMKIRGLDEERNRLLARLPAGQPNVKRLKQAKCMMNITYSALLEELGIVSEGPRF